MIVSGRPDHAPRKLARTWVKSENEFGDTLDTIKAEFQAIGLKSIRTSYKKQDGIIIIEHRTYPIAFAVSNSECEATYTFMLQTIKDAYLTLYNMNLIQSS